uniref:TRAFAC clade GTPase domain-containing protein n=1 Tax=unclassified Variovorax TaxID=663243 RepID=UPI000D369300
MPQLLAFVLGAAIVVFVLLPALLFTLSVLALCAGVLSLGLAARYAAQAAAEVADRRRRADPVLIHGEAHHAYLLGPAWWDLRAFFIECNRRAVEGIAGQRDALAAAVGPLRRTFRVLTLVFVASFGLLASLLVSSAIGLVLGGAALALTALLGLLYLVDNGWLAARGLFVYCPLCDRKLFHLHYDCPHCTGVPMRHRHLRVNRAGALFHRCGSCDGRIAAHVLTGRGLNERAYCTHCEHPIGRALVEARNVHIAVVGGADSGKTTLLVGIARWLRRTPADAGIRVDLEDAAQRAQMTAWIASLESGHAPPKTGTVRHRALTFMVEAPGQRLRSLYFFDTSGEMFRSRALKERHGYFALAHAILFTLDPFGITSYAAGLKDTPQWPAVSEASPSAAPAWEIASSMINLLDDGQARRSEGRFEVPLTVVVTKTDLLGLHREIGADGATIRGWLQAHGAEDVVRVLDANFSTVDYRTSLVPMGPLAGDGAPAGGGIDDLMPALWARALPDLPLDAHVASKESVTHA